MYEAEIKYVVESWDVGGVEDDVRIEFDQESKCFRYKVQKLCLEDYVTGEGTDEENHTHKLKAGEWPDDWEEITCATECPSEE